MATLAFVAGRLLQQAVVELPGRPETFHPSMIAMAGDTVRADEFLVERCRSQGFLDWQTCSGEFSYLLRLVTADAALLCGTGEGGMTGKTVRFQFCMAGNQLAGANHQVGIDESQNGQHYQVGGKDPLQRAAHTQPQNKKMLMM